MLTRVVQQREANLMGMEDMQRAGDNGRRKDRHFPKSAMQQENWEKLAADR